MPTKWPELNIHNEDIDQDVVEAAYSLTPKQLMKRAAGLEGDGPNPFRGKAIARQALQLHQCSPEALARTNRYQREFQAKKLRTARMQLAMAKGEVTNILESFKPKPK